MLARNELRQQAHRSLALLALAPAMASTVSAELRSWVPSNGLGMLALGWSPPDVVREEIRATRTLTDRPFGVNLVLTDGQEERLAICVEEGVAVVSFFWGQAGPLISQAHRGEAKVLHTVASSQEARVAVSHGADVIVAQGWEAGGHVYGTVATMALVPAVVELGCPRAGNCRGRDSRRTRPRRGDGLGGLGRLDRYALSGERRGSDPSPISRTAV